MHDYDALIAKLMVLFKSINLKIEPVGEELRVVQTLGFINLPKACAAIDELGWDTWLEQLLQKLNVPVAETEPDMSDGATSLITNGKLFNPFHDCTEPDLETGE